MIVVIKHDSSGSDIIKDFSINANFLYLRYYVFASKFN